MKEISQIINLLSIESRKFVQISTHKKANNSFYQMNIFGLKSDQIMKKSAKDGKCYLKKSCLKSRLKTLTSSNV